MVQCFAQMADVKFRVVGNHKFGARQPGQQFRCDGGKFRCVQNIQMRQAVNFNEVVAKPTVAFGWPHQPIRRFGQNAIFKDRQPGGANADARVIGGFKIECW